VKVLVTGGTGFVGSQLVAALVRRGDSVRVLRRTRSSLITLDSLPVEHAVGDILDPDAVARAVKGCDWVFHVAGLSSYWRARKEEIQRVNVEGTRIVMDACLRAGVQRVVYTSSVAAIGIPANGTIGNEESAFDRWSATFAYAVSKHAAEGEVRGAADRGLPAVIVNPAVVIGAGDQYLIAGHLGIQIAQGHLMAVPPGGICVVDVDAVVQGHIAAAERGRVGERYILGGENLSYRQIVVTVAALTGQPAPSRTLPRWGLPLLGAAVDAMNRVRSRPPAASGEQIRLSAWNVFFDSGKAVRELGYPMLPFRGAAEKALRWYSEHGYIAQGSAGQMLAAPGPTSVS
jgi:dihydroflavonol-4-reductase